MFKKVAFLGSGLITAIVVDKVVSIKQATKTKSMLVSSGVALLGVAGLAVWKSKESLFFSGGASIWAIYQALRTPNKTNLLTQDNALSVSFKNADVSLETLLAQNNIQPPRTPQTLKVVLDVYNRRNDHIDITRYFWRNAQTDDARTGWVPASTVKVFAVVSALQRLTELGFDDTAIITFKDVGQKISIADLITRTIVDSDNMSYNRLVQLAGHSRMSEMLDKDFPNTALNKPYLVDDWSKLTRGNTTFNAPDIVVSDSKKTTIIEAAAQRPPSLCKSVSACTQLSELNSLMARATIFQNLQISKPLHDRLLRALAAPKPRGSGFSNSIEAHATKYEFMSFHKHGFNGEWYSQTVVLLNNHADRAFVVSAVGAKGDRTLLNDVGRAIGELIQKAF